MYCYSDFWYYRSLLYYGKFLKNREKIRKNLKVLRTASLESKFADSYKKRVYKRTFRNNRNNSRKENPCVTRENPCFTREKPCVTRENPCVTRVTLLTCEILQYYMSRHLLVGNFAGTYNIYLPHSILQISFLKKGC